MLQGVLAAADIERIAVCQEGQAFLLFDDVGHSLGEIGAQKCQVARLAKVNLNGDEFILHIDGADAGFFDELFQLIRQADAVMCVHVCEIDF